MIRSTSLQHEPRVATPHPTARERVFADQIRDLITADDVSLALQRTREALSAEVSMRAPRAKSEDGKREANNYLIVADWPVRLAAVKLLLAYKFGNPVSAVDMQLALPAGNGDERKPLSREEMVEQLRSSGANLAVIAQTWLEGVKRVEDTGPAPADIEKTAEVAQALAVVDV